MPGRDAIASAYRTRARNGASAAAETQARLAAELRRSGRLADSIGPLLEVVRFDPENVDAHNDLGLTYLQCGRHAEAIDSLQRAATLRPGFADAWHNLGLALGHAGRETEAMRAYGKAIALAPRHAEALRQLGELLLNTNKRAAAARCFARASAASSDPLQRRLDEARRLMTLEQYRDAETCLRQAVALDPDGATGQRLLGHVLSVIGRFADAATHFDRALAMNPEEVAACYDLATVRKMTETDRPLIARMRQALETPGLPEKLAISLHFALGKTFDDLGDYAAAMRHYDAGNAARHRTEHLDHEACARGFDATIAAFSPEAFASGGGSANETPLFILGLPRSGTTLVEQILSAHPDIGAGGELGFWDERARELARQPSLVPSAGFAAKTAKDYLALLRQISPSTRLVTDKAPSNFERIGLIHRVFPRARIIHCRRNPVDTCLSIYFTNFGSRQGFAYDKSDLAFYYRQYRRLMAHWRSVLPRDRLLEIDYESLIADRGAGTRRLLEFCGVPWDDACMHPERNDRAVTTASRWQARQPVYATSVARWRRYEPWLGPLRSLLDDGQGPVPEARPEPPVKPPAKPIAPGPIAGSVLRVAPNLGVLTPAGRNAQAAEQLRQDMFAAHTGARPKGPNKGPLEPVQRQPKLAEQQRRIGIQLIAANRIGEAIRALRDAVRYDPTSAAAHHVLGVALMHGKQLEDAAIQLQRAIALKPDLSDAHKDLGIVLDRRGLEADALAAYGQAVKLAPKLADVHRRMAQLHILRAEIDAAIVCYRRAADAVPNTTEGRADRARALEMEGKFGESESVLRKMVALDPANSMAHYMLGNVLVSLGRFDEAIEHFERSLSLDPRHFRSWLGLTTAHRFTEADRPRVARMQKAIEVEEPESEPSMGLHFALGKAHDDLGEYELAMQHFDAGNRIRAQDHHFNTAAFEKRVNGLIARFTPEFFASMGDYALHDETPLLILGLPRSGTTLVEQILSSHPAIAAGDEMSFWTQYGSGAWETAEGKDFTIDAARKLARDYLAVLRGIGPQAARVTDKLLFNFLRLGLIHVLLPRARIIHCRRHPVDTCLSIYSLPFAAKIQFACRKSDLVFYYRNYARLMAHWRAVLPPDRFTEVDYERMITDREAETRRLVAFAGVDWDDACLQPERNDRAVKTASNWQVRQPVYTRSVERWRRYEPWLGELRELLG